MVNEMAIIQKGESLPFVFDRSGKSIDGWICTLVVKQFPGDTALISRVIPPQASTWPGFLTSTETSTILTALGQYRAIGLLVNASTGEQEQVPVRFHLTQAWAP